MIENGRMCVPFALGVLMSTPAAISVSAIGMSLLRAAYIRVVYPFVVEVLGSAPASRSTRTTAGWGAATAHINAVASSRTVEALTSAPRARSASTTCRLPVRAAVMSDVRPLV